MSKRVGVLTGGGDCPGLNAVIRAIVKTSKLEHGWEVIGIEDGFEGLLNDRTRPLGLADVSGILTMGGTILGTTNRGNPFKWRAIKDGKPVVYDASEETLEAIKNLGLDGLIVIGGDGTLSIANELHKRGAPIVAVPKTIDNDLAATEITFGFATARQTATEAIDKLHTTAESHHRVMIVEVMGRDAGWIALESGLAGGADAILIPEIPFRYEALIDMIERRREHGRHFSIVVVAEGAAPAGRRPVYQLSADETEPPRLGGIGMIVAEKLQMITKVETRCTVLGHIQRGGGPTPSDRLLATRFGVRAVELIAAGRLGLMVALRDGVIVDAPLAEAVEMQKLVDPEGELVQVARALGISVGDR